MQHHSTTPTTNNNKHSKKHPSMNNNNNNNTTISNNHHSHNNNINSNNNHHRISNGTQACAACKYQRRKCAPDCVLAPYFPHDRQRQFLNAHKLFGVSNITKIIRNLSPPEKDIAMRTIMYQSDARAKDPIGGCYRIVKELHAQIEFCKVELELVLQQLAICKAQAAYQQTQLLGLNHHHQTLQNVVSEDENNNVVREVGCSSNNNNEISVNDDGNYQYHGLMRCYYEGGDQENSQVVQFLGMQQNEENNGNDENRVIEYVDIQENVENNNIENESNNNNNNNNVENNISISNNHDNNDQFSWTRDSVLGSSNSGDFGSECDGLPMKLMRLNSSEPAPYDPDSHSVYETKFDNLDTNPHLTAPPREEIILEQEEVVLEDQDGGCFHNIAENDLRVQVQQTFSI